MVRKAITLVSMKKFSKSSQHGHSCRKYTSKRTFNATLGQIENKFFWWHKYCCLIRDRLESLSYKFLAMHEIWCRLSLSFILLILSQKTDIGSRWKQLEVVIGTQHYWFTFSWNTNFLQHWIFGFSVFSVPVLAISRFGYKSWNRLDLCWSQWNL